MIRDKIYLPGMFRIDDGHPRWFQDEDVSLLYHSGTQIHHAFDFFTTLAIPRARSRRHRDAITILRPIILVRAPCLRPAISSYIFYHISLDWNEPPRENSKLSHFRYNHTPIRIFSVDHVSFMEYIQPRLSSPSAHSLSR